MAKGGRWKGWALALAGLGALALGGGCSKLQASLDRQDTVTLGDLAARVGALEQRVADLEAGRTAAEAQATPGGADASQQQARRIDTRQVAAGDRAVVTTDVLNVRAQPDVKATRVGQLKEGSTVQVLDVQGDWARVRFGQGDKAVAGWVSRQYIEKQE